MDYVVGSRYDISVNKGVKIVKIGVGVGVGGLLGWCVCMGVVAGVDSAYGITGRIDDGSDLGYSDG